MSWCFQSCPVISAHEHHVTMAASCELMPGCAFFHILQLDYSSKQCFFQLLEKTSNSVYTFIFSSPVYARCLYEKSDTHSYVTSLGRMCNPIPLQLKSVNGPDFIKKESWSFPKKHSLKKLHMNPKVWFEMNNLSPNFELESFASSQRWHSKTFFAWSKRRD